jgi:endoglucanase
MLGTEAMVLADPGHGTLRLTAEGHFTYTPAAGFAGADTFRYFAIDAKGLGHIGEATVTVAADTVVLRVAGDAWQGDPSFDVTVGGQVFRGLTTSADHAAGDWQEITLSGDFGGRPDSVAVSFTNDAWGGVGCDRNLYVRDLTVNGETYDAGVASSSAGFTFANVAPLATAGTVTFDTSVEADVLILKIAGDSWDGDPEFQITVNGRLAQGFTAEVAHGEGWQEIEIRGSLGPDDHARVRVDFMNDIWEGVGKDRNLYIGAVTYDGQPMHALHEGSAEFLPDAALLSRNDGLTFDL